MTKKPEFLKLVSVAIMASSLLAGCATDGASDDDALVVAPPTPTDAPATTDASVATDAPVVTDAPATTGPSVAAKNAIYSAKIKNARAKRAGYEWRDTGKLIEEAEAAAAKGDNDEAISLARKAKAQAEIALKQAEIEKARFSANHGASTLGFSSDDYTVILGDNLWDISAKGSVYGNPYQWPLIYKANVGQIKDADLIYAEQVFSIPSASSADVSAAVQHAKTRGAWTLGESEASDQEYLAQ